MKGVSRCFHWKGIYSLIRLEFVLLIWLEIALVLRNLGQNIDCWWISEMLIIIFVDADGFSFRWKEIERRGTEGKGNKNGSFLFLCLFEIWSYLFWILVCACFFQVCRYYLGIKSAKVWSSHNCIWNFSDLLVVEGKGRNTSCKCSQGSHDVFRSWKSLEIWPVFIFQIIFGWLRGKRISWWLELGSRTRGYWNVPPWGW